MAPCNGSASIDIKSGSPSSWQSLPSFNSSDDYNLASVTIPAKFTEQACMVTAGPKDTAFDIAVYTTLYDRPMPGSGGMLSAEMLSAGIARVLINTTETEVMQSFTTSLKKPCKWLVCMYVCMRNLRNEVENRFAAFSVCTLY